MSSANVSYQNETSEVVTFCNDEGRSIPKIANIKKRSSKSVFLILAGCAFVATMMVAVFSGRTTTTAVTSAQLESVELLGSSNSAAPGCTFEECRKSNCNFEMAPYMCLFHNGGPHGGCSAYEWTTETCTTQCDTSGCSLLDVPDDTDSCNSKCTEDWCIMNRLCELPAKYQCTNGAATFGCSPDEYQWTYKTTEATCSSCCDATTCEE